MATLNEPRKKRARVGCRYSMELNFASEDVLPPKAILFLSIKCDFGFKFYHKFRIKNIWQPFLPIAVI